MGEAPGQVCLPKCWDQEDEEQLTGGEAVEACLEEAGEGCKDGVEAAEGLG